MKYVDAGYIIALSVLFLYVVSLLARRRRLERAAAVAEVAQPDGRPSGTAGTVGTVDAGPPGAG